MTAEPTRPWEYTAFAVRVARKQRITPNFIRITVTAPALRHFAPWALDQRIKLVLPMADGSRPEFGLEQDPTPPPKEWYTRWKALPESRRNTLRTYTPARICPELGEVDIDVFLHQPAGPASCWALDCQPGDRLTITGPDIRAGYTGYGISFLPPRPPSRLLLIGDASALPAIRNIITAQATAVPTEVLLQLADPADNTLGPLPPEVNQLKFQSSLATAVRDWGIHSGVAFASDPAAYAWIAGESAVTLEIRRYLTTALTIPKERIAFCGYWKLGGPLINPSHRVASGIAVR